MLYGKNSLLVRADTDIFFAFSTDNGQTFSTPDNLNNETSDFSDPQISSSGNNVYVVWEDSTLAGGNDDIFFAFSTDNGQTFSTPDNLSESTELPLIHKSLLQEITYMWYGKNSLLLATLISFLHSVQIMARHLAFLITSVRVLDFFSIGPQISS